MNRHPWVKERACLQMLAEEMPTQLVVHGRGLHSSTFQLNVSAVCGIGGAFRKCVGGV